jgi:hypothetical protein
MVVLDRPDWLAWLDLTRPESELLRPLPAGSLAVEQVRFAIPIYFAITIYRIFCGGCCMAGVSTTSLEPL